jgi:hypothetical protein
VRAPHKSSVYRSFFPDLHHPIYGDVQASAQYVDFSASNGHHWHLDSPEIGQQCQLKDVHGDRFKRRAMFRSLCASCKDGAQAARRNKPRLGQVCADAGMLVCAAPRRGRTERIYQAIIERTAAGGVAGPGREAAWRLDLASFETVHSFADRFAAEGNGIGRARCQRRRVQSGLRSGAG